MNKGPFAEDLPYFKTGQRGVERWSEMITAELLKIGGRVTTQAWGQDSTTGREAYAVQFSVGEDQFRVVWPVLAVRRNPRHEVERNQRAARIQAITCLYHDIKAMCVKARALGPRPAFFSHFLLPDGREASRSTPDELLAILPPVVGAPRLEGPRNG